MRWKIQAGQRDGRYWPGNEVEDSGRATIWLSGMRGIDDKMKKKIACMTAILMAAVTMLGGCGQTLSDAGSASSTPRKIIIDTDTGADDAAAIILAAMNKNVEILGVTVLAGNVDIDQATENALMALEITGNSAPVYKGATSNYKGEEIDAFSVFGTDGMGDMDLIHPSTGCEEGDAVDFILDTLNKYPGEVEIIAIGPATNIARAIEKDPETMKKAKTIWSMGTTGLGPGNSSPVSEFNVYHDPEAYKLMLDSGLDITVVGLDVCGDSAMWTPEDFKKLKATNDIGKFVDGSFDKLREFYISNGTDGSVMNCDTVAMMCALYPDFVTKTITCHGSCITDEGETRAQVIFYQQGFTYDVVDSSGLDYNVTLVNDVRKDEYFSRFVEAIK
ncbi:MAG: nucleoside hydrolase [Lachnospiraceae bacterium]|nr:nucleoside hydrolase [Lachnospiraceae bacterium]